jgi:hypothetical protein
LVNDLRGSGLPSVAPGQFGNFTKRSPFRPIDIQPQPPQRSADLG